MAHRQLSSLVHRVCRQRVYASVHHRAVQQPLDVHCLIADGICLKKLGSRFFSKSLSQRKAAGKLTNDAQSIVSPHGQGIASQAHEDQSKSISNQAFEDQSMKGGSSEQSSSKYALILGAGTVLAISLFAFFPRDLLKSYYGGEKKDLDVSLEDFREKTSKGAFLPPKAKEEAEDEKPGLLVVQVEEHEKVALEPEKETDIHETANTQSMELLVSGSEGELASATESIALKKASSSPSLDENIAAVKAEDQMMLKAESKDVDSHLAVHTNDHLSGGELSPTTLSDESKDKQNLVTFTNREDMVVPIPQRAGSYASTKELTSMQTPSRSPGGRPSILEAYYLGEVSNPSSQDIENNYDLSEKSQSGNHQGEDSVNKLHIDGVQNVLDLLDIVHAAEKRQAELDAEFYKEALRRLKHVFQQELKDAQAKEVMYAEEASRLVKEIELEKERAAATLESEQKIAREKFSEELKQKEEEANFKLKKVELLSKTEVAAALAKEKLSYINDVRNVKQELEALYMVLFAQSKDFLQRHTIHKLAMGTIALEDAMKKGSPLEKEITLICSAYRDTGFDPLLEAILSSLPEQAVKKGTLTPHQLEEKFENLKKGVLELSLIPATGGGLISHAAAKIVSALKVKEKGHFSEGGAAIISQVQRCLADGKLVDAAELLEKSVHGTKAQALVADWIENVKERAVMEQMLLLLQAHTTAAASSLA